LSEIFFKMIILTPHVLRLDHQVVKSTYENSPLLAMLVFAIKKTLNCKS
jgi:hypothetical protein